MPHVHAQIAARADAACGPSPATARDGHARCGDAAMPFELNVGQTSPEVAFTSSGRGYRLFLTPREVVFARRDAGVRDPSCGAAATPADAAPSPVRMGFRDASATTEVVGVEPLASTSSYFTGRDPRRWRTRVPHFARVEYRELYPGIDLVFHRRGGALEYDFVVAPGRDPGVISLAFEGVERIRLEGGDLVLELEGGGALVQRAPRAYEAMGDITRELPARYAMVGDCAVGFTVEGRDPGRRLVIDPVIAYATYLGGSDGDEGEAIAIDASGSAYVIGRVSSPDFPTVSPVQPSHGGGVWDAFVAKLDPSGSALVYATYLGGSGLDEPQGIAVDANGDAYLTGTTDSTDFPTAGPLQPGSAGIEDAFVTRLSADGSTLVYSTYLGGGLRDFSNGIAVDPAGVAYITGNTTSTDFPTASPLQASPRGAADAFVSALAPDGSALVYSTYLGGIGSDSGNAIAVDPAGAAYVGGQTSSRDFPTASPLQGSLAGTRDAFVAQIAAGGSALVYSTYLGGSASETGIAIAIDDIGAAYLTGDTTSADFPTVNPVQASLAGFSDAFVSKLVPDGSALAYATYLGGTGDEAGIAIAVGGFGHAHVTGFTSSADFPLVNPTQASNAGASDAFVARLAPGGAPLLFATYLGGGGNDQGRGIRVDANGAVYLTGSTDSTDFPVSSPLQSMNAGATDAFIVKVVESICVADAGPDGTACVGDSALLDGSGSSAPGCIAGVEYRWLEGVTEVCSFSPSPVCLVFPMGPAGPHVYTLEVRCADLTCLDSALTTVTTMDCTTAFSVTGCTSVAVCPLGGPGSGNGEVDPGESAETSITVQNTGTAAATNVTAVVTSPTPGVTITGGIVLYGDLQPGQSSPGLAPVAYDVSPQLTCGTSIQLDVAISSDQGPGTGGCSVLVPAACDRCLPTPCNLTVPACSATPCLGGCAGDVTVRHESRTPCAGGGSFDLTATRYEQTCASGSNGCPVDVPPLRLWAYDSYLGANSGCEPLQLENAGLDGVPGPIGRWVAGTSWRLPLFDGCIESSSVRRSVVEVSFPELAAEGTVDHYSRFVVASLPESSPGAYDLDLVRGSGNACGTSDLPLLPVPLPLIPGKPGNCAASNDVLEGAPSSRIGFFDAPVALRAPSPAWYSEAGADGGPPLVAGYQVLYALGVREPTSSDAATGGWLPVYDPGDPSLRLGVQPLGTPGVTVSIPMGPPGARAWIATRLVYQDRTLNPGGPFDVASPGPLVVSDVSYHCGPIARPRLADSVARYGQPSLPPGAPVTLFTQVRNTSDPALTGFVPGDALDVVVTIAFDPCVDLGSFDPVSDPSQVEVTYHGSGTAPRALLNRTSWDPSPPPPQRPTLTIRFDEGLPPVPSPPSATGFPYVEIRTSGLAAGSSTTPSCCSAVHISHGNNPNLLPVPDPCFAITNCAPQPMRNLALARRLPDAGGLRLAWDPPPDPGATVGIHVWKLLGGDPSLIPSANLASASSFPTSLLRLACEAAASATTCIDAESTPGDLHFYQVRAVCFDGSESP